MANIKPYSVARTTYKNNLSLYFIDTDTMSITHEYAYYYGNYTSEELVALAKAKSPDCAKVVIDSRQPVKVICDLDTMATFGQVEYLKEGGDNDEE